MKSPDRKFTVRNTLTSGLVALAITAVSQTVMSVGPAQAAASSLHGVIKQDALWQTYKARFMKADGRVVDNANGNIVHSEGQGFAMLMAVAADDRLAFETIWSFTRNKLGVRRDNLLAWKWRPALFGNVRDKNNATDGDILVAWALLEASKAGFGKHHRKRAIAILRDVKKLIKSDDVYGRFLRPAHFGFSAPHHEGREIINLSYWIYPAFERITAITGDRSWKSLARSGEMLLKQASANRAGLPADWNTLKRNKGIIGTSRRFKSDFSYNAIRVPLYLAWSKSGSFPQLEAFQKNWVNRSRTLQQVNVKTNRGKNAFRDLGYQAVAAVINCSVSGKQFPQNLRHNLDKLYYPASLHLLSVIATKQRYPQCW